MRKFIAIMLLTFFLVPLATLSVQASTTNVNQVAVVNNLNNSNTMDSVEKVRNNSNGNYDEFIQKIRKPSIPIAITLIALSGMLFLIGFWIEPFKKAGGALFTGVLFGLFFINFGEYIVGWMFAGYDFLVGYF